MRNLLKEPPMPETNTPIARDPGKFPATNETVEL
ncbi:MAG: hypothetical protein QOH03_478 [Kribbellaceae bacterium]|jgi:hypothetical protein|nr:hypothetical protein [Kribbellaceae bacterium]